MIFEKTVPRYGQAFMVSPDYLEHIVNLWLLGYILFHLNKFKNLLLIYFALVYTTYNYCFLLSE